MDTFGIGVAKKGHTIKIGTPFTYYMWYLHVEFKLKKSDLSTEMPKGKSKLKKWTCGCQNVRVGTADFHAKCTRCGNDFLIET